MTDTTPNLCDDTRRILAKRLITKYPALKWTCRLMVPPEVASTLTPDELGVIEGEFILMSADEVLWSLPATSAEPPPPPVPVETETLFVMGDVLNIRSVPDASDDKTVLRQVTHGAALVVEKPDIIANKIIWRKLAGQVAYVAKVSVNGATVYLSPNL